MPEFRVTYEIDVDEATPTLAALKVYGYMLDPCSQAPVLSVVNAVGHETVIDLSDVE